MEAGSVPEEGGSAMVEGLYLASAHVLGISV